MDEGAVLDENDTQTRMFDNIMLDLRVEIGRVKIKIAKLMTLDVGDVVQLDQDPQAALIIYANDKPIAKGQIISSNGKYSIRIL